jgi:hypothetical protein
MLPNISSHIERLVSVELRSSLNDALASGGGDTGVLDERRYITSMLYLLSRTTKTLPLVFYQLDGCGICSRAKDYRWSSS